jgi:hypothetical protein
MPTQQQRPRSASSYRLLSASIAARAVREARKAKPRGPAAVAGVIAAHQIAQAVAAERAVDQMLTEQAIDAAAEALLNAPAFTTQVDQMLAALDQELADFQFDRLVESEVQDAGRAAQQVAVTARPDVGWVRHLTLPSCSRCAVLAGRVYRYSQGFQRHPGCDCVMLPVTVGNTDYVYDIEGLVESGQVTGMSKADRKALRDGADFNQVVNVRSRKAGLRESGRVITRAGRLTPEAIYRRASTRDEALSLLQEQGYLR